MFELFDTDATEGALVGVGLSGLAPVIGVTQGCTPIGEPDVAGVESNVIHRIGSRPTLEVLADALRAHPGAEARVQRAGVFAGLAMDPAKSPLERGDVLVRNLVGVEQSSGAMPDELAGRLGGRRPAFGCYFDWAGRVRGLFGIPDHDVTLIRERLGESPLVGSSATASSRRSAAGTSSTTKPTRA